MIPDWVASIKGFAANGQKWRVNGRGTGAGTASALRWVGQVDWPLTKVFGSRGLFEFGAAEFSQAGRIQLRSGIVERLQPDL